MQKHAEASSRFIIDAMYQAAYGACLQTLAVEPGPEEIAAAEDTASKIVKCILDDLPYGEDVNVSLCIGLAATTGVSCGEELRFRWLTGEET